MKVSHVAGSGVGVLAGAVALAICNHFGIHPTDVDATIIGSAALSIGAAVGHALSRLGEVVGRVGVVGACRQLLHGAPPATPAVTP